MAGRRGKGEGSIYQREDGVWIGAIDLGWIDGKRSRKVVSAQTRGEIVKRLRELQPIIAQGIAPAPDRLTVGEYLNGWIANRIPISSATGTISFRNSNSAARTCSPAPTSNASRRVMSRISTAPNATEGARRFSDPDPIRRS